MPLLMGIIFRSCVLLCLVQWSLAAVLVLQRLPSHLSLGDLFGLHPTFLYCVHAYLLCWQGRRSRRWASHYGSLFLYFPSTNLFDRVEALDVSIKFTAPDLGSRISISLGGAFVENWFDELLRTI